MRDVDISSTGESAHKSLERKKTSNTDTPEKVISKRSRFFWSFFSRDRSFITSQGGGGGGGGAVVLEGGGTILKQAPFWGVNFSLVRNMRGVKFYDTATAV